MINQGIEDLKKRLPNDPRIKPYLDKIVADGFTEEQAKDIMITAWIKWKKYIELLQKFMDL